MTPIDTAPNEVRRFIIDDQPVRGYWVDMESAWQELRAHSNYPQPVRDLLGEAVSAAVLLAATLKFEGTLTLQLEGKGNVRLLVAQCSHDFRVRAVARFDEDKLPALGATFGELVGQEGRVIVTIEAAERDMRYQGVVPLSGASLSECLESYFASSEQLPTRVRLAADEHRAVGLLVQKLPDHGGEEVEQGSPSAVAWQAAEKGVESVQPAELVGASFLSLLSERFGQQDLRVFKGAPVQFACRCSPARVAGLLRTLGADEVRDVLKEQGAVEVTCEFCHRPYRFDATAVEQLFDPDGMPDSNTSVH
ncbi:MAG: Hsp33 family molecular chaperone HslO [Gammaproteobacteria bacterium]